MVLVNLIFTKQLYSSFSYLNLLVNLLQFNKKKKSLYFPLFYKSVESIETFVTHQKENMCNSMPFGAAWAYYGKVLVLVSAA